MRPVLTRALTLPAIAAGFTVWGIAFVILYAALSIGCELGWDARPVILGLSLQRLQLVVLFLLHLAAGLWLASALKRCLEALEVSQGEASPYRFLASVAWLGAVAGVASTAFSFFGVFWLTTCV